MPSTTAALHEACAKQGIATTGKESVTELMNLMRSDGTSTTALVDDPSDKPTGKSSEKIGFKEFFAAERPLLIAAGFPEDDDILKEEAKERFGFYQATLKKQKTKMEKGANVDDSTKQSCSQTLVCCQEKLDDVYALRHGMTFLRKDELATNPYIYLVDDKASAKNRASIGKDTWQAAQAKSSINDKDKVAKVVKSSALPLAASKAKSVLPVAAAESHPDPSSRKRKQHEEPSDFQRKEPYGDDDPDSFYIKRIKANILKYMSRDMIKTNIEQMGYKSMGNKVHLADFLAGRLVYNSDEDEDDEDEDDN